jgi:hypothetical protein
MSGIGVFYPDKTPTQRVGVIPDFVATPTLEGIRDGRDEVLERALRLILPDLSEDRIQQLGGPLPSLIRAETVPLSGREFVWYFPSA